MGLVEIRHGSGAYVVRRPQAMVTISVNLMLDLDGDSAGHLMTCGCGWRRQARGTTSRQPSLAAADVAAIEAALHRLRDCAASDRPGRLELIAADTVFHATVVRAAGNPYLAAIFESVHGAVLKYQLRDWVDSAAAPLWLRHGGADHQWALHEPSRPRSSPATRRRAGGRPPPPRGDTRPPGGRGIRRSSGRGVRRQRPRRGAKRRTRPASSASAASKPAGRPPAPGRGLTSARRRARRVPHMPGRRPPRSGPRLAARR